MGLIFLTMFWSLLKPQILINFYSKSSMILIISINLTCLITKDLVIFTDYCCWLAWTAFENLMNFMQFGMETWLTTPPHESSTCWWCSLIFCRWFAWIAFENLMSFIGNLINYPPPESPKSWWCSLIFCCWFARIAYEILMLFIQFGRENLFAKPLNHQNVDDVHWLFWLLVCMNSTQQQQQQRKDIFEGSLEV